MALTDVDSVLAMPAAREHPVAAVVRLRAMRKALWMRHVWALEPVHTAAIHHEEVDRILADPTDIAEREAAFYRDHGDAAEITNRIEELSTALAADTRWNRLVEVFSLSASEQQLLSLAVALGFDPTLGRVFAYLHDQLEMTYPTQWLAAGLFGPGAERVSMAKDSGLLKWRLVSRAPDSMPVQGIWLGWVADPGIVAWIDRDDARDLPAGAVLKPASEFEQLPLLFPAECKTAGQFLSASEFQAAEIELVGPAGSGRGVLAGQIAARAGKSLLTISEPDALDCGADADVVLAVLAAFRSARLHDAIVYWREGRDSSPVARRAMRSMEGVRFVGRATPMTEREPGTALRSIEMPSLDRTARARLWTAVSRDEMPAQARDWLLTPGEIVQLSRVVHAGDAAIQQACHRPAESLSLLIRTPLPFKPSDLILPVTIQKSIDDFENQIRFRWDVYEKWGFSRLCPNGRGVIGLFSGPSGTGKTMAAQVLARKLGLELYRLDLSQVVNKYVGETEKRLKTIFDECDHAHFMLLIDECEGIFGQRFSSKDAHDHWANVTIGFLLMRLEQFQGIGVLSTNRKGDLDAAFVRRIRFIVDFLPPGPEERARLWKNALPARSPSGEVIVGDLQWEALAERVPLTGAEITLVALNAAFLARAAHETIGMSHVLEAARRELAKKGQALRGFE
jgi:hypothetical protein